ncbi:MAG: polymer-forming cytoskeletal protein [Acidobacteria bacterium]|nr:polymer-forming cytoskeletal protein [Acidobacteriota bacterium]
MFEKKTNGQVPACHTLLGKGTLWKGEVHAGATSLRIEGTVEGTVHSEGEVTIAPSGLVTGTVHAKHLIVTGKAEGLFKIEQCLEIHGTGCVEGDVEVGSLVVDEGGTLQGTCVRRGHKASGKLHLGSHEPKILAMKAEGPLFQAEPQAPPLEGETVAAGDPGDSSPGLKAGRPFGAQDGKHRHPKGAPVG